MPAWVKEVVDQWLQAANLSSGKLFRRVHKIGKAWGNGMTEKAVWHIVREYAAKAGIEKLAPHDLRSYAAWKIMPSRPSNPLWFAGFLSDDSA
jgi:site-specific recombinase XerD